jgi:S-adenosylmethionine:tRNA ribosyltransferase-isomerase
MRTEDFDFDLPRACIADRPARPRDSARLLHVGDGLRDHGVRALPELMAPGDVMVFNDTRVIPARLWGRRGDARIEVTLHKPAGDDRTRWRVFAKPAKKLRPGDTVTFDGELTARVIAKHDGGEVELAFDAAADDLLAALERVGAMPLPPYISGAREPDAQDRRDYQTVYARTPGAVAAPTAGLHFTDDLLQRLDDRGVQRVNVTLHVGAGTFLPVKAEDPAEHPMHSEYGEVPAATAEAVNAARAAGGRVVAVGTTALRLLETAADEAGTLHPFAGETDIFILPGHSFRIVERLMTNFHLPRSTLFMLVCAFSGTQRMHAAYAHARDTGYRFYSYGDACLLERADRLDAADAGA